MKVCFEKWHGCKNDFIVVWLNANEQQVFDSLRRQAPKLCRRDGGAIGADGILVLHTQLISDLLPNKLSIINSDGSLAANCGNGLRCCAGSILKRHADNEKLRDLPEIVELKVNDKLYMCQYLTDELENVEVDKLPFISVDMGVPLTDNSVDWFNQAKDTLKKFDIIKDIHVCEVGNQHIVLFNQNTSDKKVFYSVSSEIQKAWAGGINIHFTEPVEAGPQHQKQAAHDIGQSITEAYIALPWERGVGPTNACGSGACALAACAFATGDASRSDWIAIDMPGGRLYARQDDAEGPITLAGPAQLVFCGEFSF